MNIIIGAPVLELADRVSTGNPQADEILSGGFPANSINVIMGQPGTGKTIFAEQMLFHNASESRPVLYLTTLSEPFQKVVSYLQKFTFFDSELFGSSVLYDDVGHDLVTQGVAALQAKIQSVLREVQPSVIVIDSFKAVHDLMESPRETRQLIVGLAGELTAAATTTFLVGEYNSEEIARYPEFAVADGIVEFARKPLSNRDERFVRVLKLRGSHYREGLHGLRISRDGVEVFPRLTSTDDWASVVSTERVSSGVRDFDPMIGGGMWRGSSSLVLGSAGVGKTTFALQFIIDGVLRGEPGLFLHFQESPNQLARVIGALGHDLEDLKKRGLQLRYHSPVELHIDSIIADLFQTVDTAKIQRFAADAVGDLITAASDSDRLHDYLYSLMQHMLRLGVTSILTFESLDIASASNVASSTRLSYMSDNIIVLSFDRHSREPLRAIQVVKARATSHDQRKRRMTISSSGLNIE